jgi:uncharacterized protein (TIGR03066 family)
VGVWEVVKSDDMSGIDLTKLDKNSQIKMTVEFTKDGKFSVKLVDQTGRAEHPVIPVAEGTYVLDGSKFTTTQLDADNKERKDVETIKSLTDTELIMVDEKGKTDILKRASR